LARTLKYFKEFLAGLKKYEAAKMISASYLSYALLRFCSACSAATMLPGENRWGLAVLSAKIPVFGKGEKKTE
jgi:hypothetical protein